MCMKTQSNYNILSPKNVTEENILQTLQKNTNKLLLDENSTRVKRAK